MTAATEPSSFESLPTETQEYLRRRAATVERHRHSGFAGAWLRLGAPLRAAVRAFYWLEGRLRLLHGKASNPGLRSRLAAAARRSRAIGRAGGAAYERLAYRCAEAANRSRLPTPRNVPAATRDPEALLRFVEGMPVLPGTEPFSIDRRRNCMVATLVGFDFLRSADRMFFLEINEDPALRRARAQIYTDGDPMWARLLEFCGAQGFRTIIVYGYRPFSPSHRGSLSLQARRSGVAVRIIDDVFACAPQVRERSYFMERRAADTLILRAKYFRTHFDAAVKDKRLSFDLVGWYNRQVGAERQVQVPRALSAAEVRERYDPRSFIPNAVIKEAFADRGHGVHFFKGREVPALSSRADILTQEFILPDCVEHRTVRGRHELLSASGARHVRVFRTHALLLPSGPLYLSGHTVNSLSPLPDGPLPDGQVRESSRFMANFSAGAVYGQLSAAEEPWCRDATERAGTAFHAWIRMKYDIPDVPGIAGE